MGQVDGEKPECEKDRPASSPALKQLERGPNDDEDMNCKKTKLATAGSFYFNHSRVSSGLRLQLFT